MGVGTVSVGLGYFDFTKPLIYLHSQPHVTCFDLLTSLSFNSRVTVFCTSGQPPQ